MEPCPSDANLFLSLHSTMETPSSATTKATLYSKEDGVELEAKVVRR